jgi:hypothetical protein
MASHQSFGQHVKILHSQAREIIANVIAFMKNGDNQELNIPIANYKQRAAAPPGISEQM